MKSAVLGRTVSNIWYFIQFSFALKTESELGFWTETFLTPKPILSCAISRKFLKRDMEILQCILWLVATKVIRASCGECSTIFLVCYLSEDWNGSMLSNFNDCWNYVVCSIKSKGISFNIGLKVIVIKDVRYSYLFVHLLTLDFLDWYRSNYISLNPIAKKRDERKEIQEVLF